MSGVTPIEPLDRTSPSFKADCDEFFASKVPQFSVEINDAAREMTAAAAAQAMAIGYTFSNVTTDADPGVGELRLNNATQASATQAFIDLADSASVDWSTVIDSMDDSDSAVKGQVRLTKVGDGTKWIFANLTGVATGAPSYRKLALTILGASSANPFADGDAITLAFSRTGDKGNTGNTGAAGTNGIDGANPGLGFAFDNATSAADPGVGKFRLNSGALASVTAMYISETDRSGNAVSAVIQGWDDSTNTVKGTLKIAKAGSPTTMAVFNVTGTISDGGAFDTVALSFVQANGSFSSADVCYLEFSRAGDQGTAIIGYTFIAAGTLADGSLVALRSDGKVEVVAQTTVAKTDSARVTSAATNADYLSSCYGNGKVVLVYEDVTLGKLRYAVGTVAAGAITFGSPGDVDTGACSFSSVCYDAANDRFVVAYQNTSNGIYVNAGTLSGNTITWGTRQLALGAVGASIKPVLTYGAAGKCAVLYTGNNVLYARVVTGTGTTATLGTQSSDLTAGNAAGTDWPAMAYDANTDVFAYAYQDTTNNVTKGSALSISGTTIANLGSLGANITLVAQTATNHTLVNVGASNFLLLTIPTGSNLQLRSVSINPVQGAMTTSGTYSGMSSGFNSDAYYSIAYSPTLYKGVIGGYDGSGFRTQTFTITKHGNLVFDTTSTVDAGTAVTFASCVSDTASGKFVASFALSGGSGNAKSYVVTPPSVTTNADAFIGVSKSAVTDAAATIAVGGMLVTNQSGLATGSRYFLTDSGTLTTTPNRRFVGRAKSATELLIESCDPNSGFGALVPLREVNSYGAALTSLDFDGVFTDHFDNYLFIGDGIGIFGSGGNTHVVMQVKSGGTWQTGTYGAHRQNLTMNATTYGAQNTGGEQGIVVGATSANGIHASGGFEIKALGPYTYESDSGARRFEGSYNSGAGTSGQGGGAWGNWNSKNQIDGVRFRAYNTSDSIRGSIKCFGIRNTN